MTRSAFAVISFLLVAGCGIVGPDEVTVQLEGTVTAQETGQAVAGARIELFEFCLCFGESAPPLATITTDAQGRYTITKSVDERACESELFGFGVRASAPGFATEVAEVNRCDGGVERIDIVLDPPAVP